jgi:phosphate transport system ATP-binding protein
VRKDDIAQGADRLYDMYPDERVTGEALMDGRSILEPEIDLNLLRRRIGMVFQGPTPFPMSVFENVALGRDLSRTYRARTRLSASRNR